MRALALVNTPSNFLPPSWVSAITNAGQRCTSGVSGSEVCNFQPSLLISILLPNVFIGAGIIFLIIIIAAGWKVVGSAGQESSAQEKAKASAALTYSVIGFLLVVSAYFILQILGVITGVDFIHPTI